MTIYYPDNFSEDTLVGEIIARQDEAGIYPDQSDDSDVFKSGDHEFGTSDKGMSRTVIKELTRYKRTCQCRGCGIRFNESPASCVLFNLTDERDNVNDMVYAGRSWPDIQGEIERCIPLCKDCHLEW